jgi:hypothetical protein
MRVNSGKGFGRMLYRRLLCCVAVTLGLLAPWPAAAGLITWGWTGTITEVVVLAGPGPPAGVVVGGQVSGVYTFESSTPDSEPDPGLGAYEDALSGLEATVGTDVLSIPSPSSSTGLNTIAVKDGDPDAYQAFALDVAGTSSVNEVPVGVAVYNVLVEDFLSTMLSSTELPVTPDFFDPDAYVTTFHVRIARAQDVDDYEVVGGLDSLFFISAPEPSAGMLIIVGVSALASLRGGRRRL